MSAMQFLSLTQMTAPSFSGAKMSLAQKSMPSSEALTQCVLLPLHNMGSDMRHMPLMTTTDIYGNQGSGHSYQKSVKRLQPTHMSKESSRGNKKKSGTNVESSLSNPSTPSVVRRNERERNRVKQVNMGFEKLRQHVPRGAKNKKMSKVDTLRSAVDYIKQLQTLLDDTDAMATSLQEPGNNILAEALKSAALETADMAPNAMETSSHDTESTGHLSRSHSVDSTHSQSGYCSDSSGSCQPDSDSSGSCHQGSSTMVPGDVDLLDFTSWFQ